jgi:membrane dipeptidase
LAELARRGWSDQQLAEVAGANLLRVMTQAESVSARLRAQRPPSRQTREALDPLPLPAAH